MILHKPRVAIRRLGVWANGKSVYDQIFKDGANIIRGKNSSGKSTIADFIFYALGGDFSKWKHEASLCDHVVAELAINNTPVTVKRRIEPSQRQSMMIFFGTYDQANASAVQGWQMYPFQRGKAGESLAAKESFSQALFRILEFPELRGDVDSNISMHQILRLIFIDQLSPVDSLLRMEQFDSALTRNTIGDLLLGVYDDELYTHQLQLVKKQRELEGVTAEYETVMQVMNEAEQETDINVINSQISALDQQRAKVMAALKGAEALEELYVGAGRNIDHLRNELVAHKQALAKLEAENQNQTFEVEDSQEFIRILNFRINALDDANQARKLLGELPLSNCPHCLAPISQVRLEIACPLCKEALTEGLEASHAARMRQELAQQIKESELLLTKKQKHLEQVRAKLPALAEAVKRLSNDYDTAISTAKSKRDEHLDKLWMTLGELDTKIEFLHKYARGVSILTYLKERKVTMETEISRLQLSVKEKISRQRGRKAEVQTIVEEKTLYLLHNDLPLEGAFKSATKVTFDFGSNNFAVNDENQFSASSMVYLKNSIHFAIFWASLELPFFRYPRLFISDDIEDKGMHPTRSQNFQRLIVALSKEFDVSHQIIFTTSMIDPELDKTDLCIGPAYGPNNKTLSFR
jgi:uncharacterized Zn finger protein (UPF0148 family)